MDGPTVAVPPELTGLWAGGPAHWRAGRLAARHAQLFYRAQSKNSSDRYNHPLNQSWIFGLVFNNIC